MLILGLLVRFVSEDNIFGMSEKQAYTAFPYFSHDLAVDKLFSI